MTNLFQSPQAAPAEDMSTLRNTHRPTASLARAARLETQRALSFGQLDRFGQEVRVGRIVRYAFGQ
jgi:hypothetical protein